MSMTKILFIGGFLGAGKTTLLHTINRRLLTEGQAVGLVTNDQAPELVDTLFLSQGGQNIQEVSGSCFCCNYNGLTAAIQQVQRTNKATIILAEPVGSCTDLSATILQPLKEQLGKDFSLGPLSVVVDSQRLQAFFQNLPTGLHADAEYIFSTQLEEADILVVNKIDQLTPEERTKLREQICQRYPEVACYFLSAKTGEGVQHWLDAVKTRNDAGGRIIEVDYERYARGEALLGWLNATMECTGMQTDWNTLARTLLSELSHQLEQRGATVGHIKLIITTADAAPIIANVTGTRETLDLRGPIVSGDRARLTLNARAELSPQQLEQLVQQTLDTVCGHPLSYTIEAWKSLKPGRPTPTHRYDHVVAVRG